MLPETVPVVVVVLNQLCLQSLYFNLLASSNPPSLTDFLLSVILVESYLHRPDPLVAGIVLLSKKREKNTPQDVLIVFSLLPHLLHLHEVRLARHVIIETDLASRLNPADVTFEPFSLICSLDPHITLITMFFNFCFTIIHSVSDELSLQIQVIDLLLDQVVEVERGDNEEAQCDVDGEASIHHVRNTINGPPEQIDVKDDLHINPFVYFLSVHLGGVVEKKMSD